MSLQHKLFAVVHSNELRFTSVVATNLCKSGNFKSCLSFILTSIYHKKCLQNKNTLYDLAGSKEQSFYVQN